MRRGYRGRMPYMEQQVVNPEMINIAPVQMYNPQDTERLAQVGQQMQQRWDASEGLIAQHLEAMGAANINPRYRDEVMEQLEGELDSLYSDIDEKYEGDFGRAVNEVKKSLASSRNLLYQSSRASEEEKIARQQYQQALQSGQAPRQIDESGNLRAIPFEVYHGLRGEEGEIRSPFDEQGKFTGYQFNPLRGAGQHGKWAANNISKSLMSVANQTDPSVLPGEIQGLWQSIRTQGFNPRNVKEYITENPEIVNAFLQDSPFAVEEFTDPVTGEVNREAAENHLVELTMSQVGEGVSKIHGQIPQIEVDGGGDGTFDRISPTIRNDLKLEDKTTRIYSEAKDAIEAAEAAAIFDNVSNELGALGAIAGTPPEEVAKIDWVEPDAKPEHIIEAEEKLEAGTGTIDDIATVWDNRIKNIGKGLYRAMQNFDKSILGGLEGVVDKVKIGKNILKTLNEGEQGERTQLYNILWQHPKRREHYGLEKTANGEITMKDNWGLGTKNLNEEAKKAKKVQMAAELTKVYSAGTEGMQEKTKKEMEKVNSFFESNPIASVRAQDIYEANIGEGVPESKASYIAIQQSIQEITDAKLKAAAYHSTSIKLDAADTPQGRNAEKRFKSNLKELIRRRPPEKLKEEWFGRRNKKEGDEKNQGDMQEFFTDNDISSAYLNPAEGVIELQIEGESKGYTLPLKELNLTTTVDEFVKAADNFLEKGRNMDFTGETISDFNYPKIKIGDTTYEYRLVTENGVLTPVILDQNGSLAESKFMQDYKNYIFGALTK